MKQQGRIAYSRFALILLGVTMLFIMAACGVQKRQTQTAPQATSPTSSQAPTQTSSPTDASKDSEFYKGKTITFLIGYAPGGGTDLEGRMLAKYLPKYIPGNPKIVIKNLPGGGGITAANVLYKETAPDGLTIATPGRVNWISAAILKEPSVQYNLNDFEWIGNTGDGEISLIMSNKTGIKSFDDLKKAPKESVIFGSWTKSGLSYIVPFLLKEEIAPAIKPVTGYSGAGDVLLAMERGEIHAAVIASASIKEDMIKSGKYRVLAKAGGDQKKSTDIIKLEDVISAGSQQLLNLIAAPALGVPMVVPPKTDPKALKVLRDAYIKMTADSEYIAENVAQAIVIHPLDADGVKKVITGLTNTSQDAIKKYNVITK